jgi:hypothetical protein
MYDGPHLLNVPLAPGATHEGGNLFATFFGAPQPHIVIVASAALTVAFALTPVVKSEMIDRKFHAAVGAGFDFDWGWSGRLNHRIPPWIVGLRWVEVEKPQKILGGDRSQVCYLTNDGIRSSRQHGGFSCCQETSCNRAQDRQQRSFACFRKRGPSGHYAS